LVILSLQIQHMKYSPFISRFVLILVVAITISTASNAQRRDHNNYRGHYGYNNYNYHSYPVFPVRMTAPYRRPDYYPRPVYRPVYRPIYRPVYYRAPHYVHYGPSFGFHINLLPYGYNTVYVGPSPYYYNDGVYYRPHANGGYDVTTPPMGAEVSKLPTDAKVTVVDGQTYYEVGGTFYQETVNNNNDVVYKVVGTDGVLNTTNPQPEPVYTQPEPQVNTQPVPPVNNNNNTYTPPVNNNYTPPVVGSRVEQLPAGSRVVVLNQQKYYISPDGIYYQEVIEGSAIKYEVTATQAN